MSLTLKFLGAAGNVTGSRHLLQADGTRVLVDCGLVQERHLAERNWSPFPVPPESLSAILLTHAHLDHSGLLPKLCRDGFRGPIYCTEATAEIGRIVLEDSGRLQEEDARFKTLRHRREGRQATDGETPLYTAADAVACAGRFAPVPYGQAVHLPGGLTATFNNGGHILGAAFVRVAVPRAGGGETAVLFSGDVGRWSVPFLEDPGGMGRVDYLVVESTYGDSTHPSEDDAAERLAGIVNAAVKAGGNVVIPTFAIERSQDLLYVLSELRHAGRIPPLMSVLDSPMAIRVNEVFRRHPELYDHEMRQLAREGRLPFDLPGLKSTRTTDESKTINSIRGTVIIMAGAGMCTGGRIKHHLAHNIARPESTILFVGYQAAGTLGRQIVDGAREVRIHGEMFPVRARIEQLHGFSAHADRDELLRWLSSATEPPRRAFVVHGEPQAAQAFAETVRRRLGWQVTVPAFGDEVVLDG